MKFKGICSHLSKERSNGWKKRTTSSFTHKPNCTHNVKLWSVRATIVAMDSNKYYIFWECVCSLSYPACNVNAPYRHLWPVRLYNIFPLYLINGIKVIGYKMCFEFLCKFEWNISHSKQNWVRYDKKMCIGLHVKYLLFLPYFNETWIFSAYFFEKYSNIKFHENPSSSSRVVPWGLTDRQTDRDTTKLIAAFRNLGKRLKTESQGPVIA